MRRNFWMLVCFAMILARHAVAEEPYDIRKRSSCSYFEITGKAQGGQVGIGFTLNGRPPLFIKTVPGETSAQVAAKLAEMLRKKEKLTVDLPVGSSTLCAYNTTEGDLYFRTTDAGIESGRSMANLRCQSDPESLTATLTWELPDPKPDVIFLYDGSCKGHAVEKHATSFVYQYPPHNGWGQGFRVVCGYFSPDIERTTRRSDLLHVWVDNPHKMASKDLKIVVDPNSLPFPLGREDGYGLTKLGGVNPCVWSIAKGSLPPGLSMNAKGWISGTAEKLGLYVVTVRLRDATGKEIAADVKVEVFNIPLYKKPKD